MPRTVTVVPPRRIVGVWESRIADMPKWKDLGINTLISLDQGADPNAWMKAAQALGLYYIRERGNIPLAQDLADPNLLGWLHQDEPELHNVPPSVLQQRYNETLGSGIPWVVDFSGGSLLGLQKVNGQAIPDSTYIAYGQASDWVSADIYPAAGWTPSTSPDGKTAISLTSVGSCLDRLSNLCAGKRQLAALECCSQRLAWVTGGGKAPSFNEMWSEAGQVIGHGADLFWFTIAFNPFTYDNTTPEIRRRMQTINELYLKS